MVFKDEAAKNETQLKADLEERRTRVRQLEAQLAELQWSYDMKNAEATKAATQLEKMNDMIARAEIAERALKPLEERNIQLEHMFAEEQAVRRKFHNQIQELKGAIRVYCRIRPRIKKEIDAGEDIWLAKSDEFSATLKREGNRDDKNYNFDGIFDETHAQEQVFKDCKDLIQSAVDGYNVTIFAVLLFSK